MCGKPGKYWLLVYYYRACFEIWTLLYAQSVIFLGGKDIHLAATDGSNTHDLTDKRSLPKQKSPDNRAPRWLTSFFLREHHL